MKKELGSNFWISKDFYHNKEYDTGKILNDLNIREDNFIFFSAGRQASRFSLKDSRIKNIKALVPAFTCYSVIEPFLLEEAEVFTYSVNKEDLLISTSKLNSLINQYNINILLVHPYFGFNTIVEDESLSKDLIVIIDETQSLYSSFNYNFYDYKLASLRKWGPLIDGSILVKKNSFNIKEDFNENERLVSIMMEAMDKKAEYMEEEKGDKDVFLSLYKEGLNCIRENKKVNRISKESLISQTHMDVEKLKEKRNENYKSLLDFPWDNIGKPIFEAIDEKIVPLYFPFYVKGDRKKLQEHLAKHDIYCPIIWTKPKYFEENAINVDENTQYIYEHILCIPIDQRYDKDDMCRVKRVLESFAK